MNPKQRIILFGGSFDPIHHGHLAMARCAKDQLAADRVIFIPAAQSPFKRQLPQANGADRMAMIRIAIADDSGFEVSDVELHRPAPSYTIDTVRIFRKRFGVDAVLYWLVGADAISELPRWYCIKELLDGCHICMMYRGGLEPPCVDGLFAYFNKEQVERLANHIIKTPLVEISSTQVRQALKDGKDVKELIPDKVFRYIIEKGLYAVSLR